LEDEKYVGV